VTLSNRYLGVDCVQSPSRVLRQSQQNPSYGSIGLIIISGGNPTAFIFLKESLKSAFLYCPSITFWLLTSTQFSYRTNRGRGLDEREDRTRKRCTA
jgi:hypothetical protein